MQQAIIERVQAEALTLAQVRHRRRLLFAEVPEHQVAEALLLDAQLAIHGGIEAHLLGRIEVDAR